MESTQNVIRTPELKMLRKKRSVNPLYPVPLSLWTSVEFKEGDNGRDHTFRCTVLILRSETPFCVPKTRVEVVSKWESVQCSGKTRTKEKALHLD